jgi:hypothetical protein
LGPKPKHHFCSFCWTLAGIAQKKKRKKKKETNRKAQPKRECVSKIDAFFYGINLVLFSFYLLIRNYGTATRSQNYTSKLPRNDPDCPERTWSNMQTTEN